MGGLVGLALGALSGMGSAAVQMGQQMQKTDDMSRLEAQRAKETSDLEAQRQALEEQKAKNISQFNYNQTNAPVERAGQYLGDASQTQVPVTPPAINNLSGYMGDGNTTNADGSPRVGFQGDTQAAIADANNIKNPDDRAAALAQINQQASAQNVSVADAYKDQKTSPNFQQSIKAAQQQALQDGDLHAYMALRNVGEDKYMTVADGAAVIDKTTGQMVFQNGDKEDRVDRRTAALERIANQKSDDVQKRIDAMADSQGKQQTIQNARVAIASINEQMKATGSQLQYLGNSPADKSKKSDLENQLAGLNGESAAWRKTLRTLAPADSVADPAAPTQPAPAPANRPPLSSFMK